MTTLSQGFLLIPIISGSNFFAGWKKKGILTRGRTMRLGELPHPRPRYADHHEQRSNAIES